MKSDDTSKSWIFQANPRYFDLNKAIHALNEMVWPVNQYKTEIHKGDRAFIWIGGNKGTGGIVAIATIITDVADFQLNDELRYVKRKIGKITRSKECVRIRIEKILNKPITKEYIKSHPILSQMTIIKSPVGTNFRIKPEEESALNDVLEKSNN